jgi:hypothetical protein
MASLVTSNTTSKKQSRLKHGAEPKRVKSRHPNKRSSSVPAVYRGLHERLSSLEKKGAAVVDEKYVKVPTLLDVALSDVKTKLSADPKMAAAMEIITTAVRPVGISLYCIPPAVHVKLMLGFKGAKVPCNLPQSGDLAAMKNIIRVALGQGKGANLGFSRPLKVRLSYDDGTRVSAAGGALATVQRIRAADSSEFTYLTNLFDEYKVESASIYWQTKASATGINTVPFGAVAYDPQINGAYASVVSVLVAMKKYGPYIVDNVFTADTNHTNVHELHARMPPGPQYEYGAVTSIATGSWTDTATTAVDYGYFKHYIESPAGAIVTALHTLQTYDVLWRCRS